MRKILPLIFFLAAIDPSSSTTYTCNPSAACGCSTNSATLGRIVGGETAGSQTWGWAVSLYMGGSLCGGSIISASWVLTAAHCAYGVSPSQMIVYAGSNNQLVGTQTRSVSSSTVHPSYNPSTYVNDIALLQLSTPLNLASASVSVICLPSVSAATLAAGEWPPAGTTVVAVGWGLTSEGGSTSSTLQQVTMQTVSAQASTCSSVITSSTSQFCASWPCKDTCQGDSGGPLMAFTSSNQWVLVGATSNGIGCARPSYAGSYTRIAAFQSWISTTTGGQYTNPTSSSLTSTTSELGSSTTCSKASVHDGSVHIFAPVLLSFILGAL